MKFGLRHIIKTMSAVAASLLLLSCSNDDPNGMDKDANDGLYTLALHISPVGTRSGGQADVNEMIESLRIIMVNNDSVEFNKLITLEIPGGILATDFKYDFLHRTPAGTKKFYFIANESSIDSPSYDTTVALPEESSDDSSFSEILDAYEAGYTDLTALDAFMQSVSFNPEYTINNGSICLPYTSIYENIEVGDKDFVEIDMYLVPVATKFYFNFKNNRPSGVEITGISMVYANTTNYMFAQVGEKDYLKKFPGETTGNYWVNWLAAVARASYGNSGFNSNMNFNTEYGWISDYEIPSPANYNELEFVAAAESFEVPPITINEEDETDPGEPGEYSVGPFYVPESKNFINPNQSGSSTEQAYFLTIGLNDLGGGYAPPFVNNGIDNLKALFRNTCVIINIIMNQGEVKVYAEISPWKVLSANGFVTEGDTPNL